MTAAPWCGFVALRIGAGWAALWQPTGDPTKDHTAFWNLYAQLLGLVARAKADDGNPNFEPHKVTRLYQEIIQASRGSRWVWALTFGSSIEGLVKMLARKTVKRSQSEMDTIAALVDHISRAPSECRLKNIAINAVRGSNVSPTAKAMCDLLAAGVITEPQVAAWKTIRHHVMHGNLVSPYSNAEEDAQLLELSTMMHALTRELLLRSEGGPP